MNLIIEANCAAKSLSYLPTYLEYLPTLLGVCSVQSHLFFSRDLNLDALADEKDPTFFQLILLPASSHLPSAPCHYHSAWSLYLMQALLLSTFQFRDHHVKLAQRWFVLCSFAILAFLARMPLQYGLLGVVLLKCQGVCEELDAVSVGTRAKASVDHVIRTSHALHNVAGEIGVYAVSWHIDCLAW